LFLSGFLAAVAAHAQSWSLPSSPVTGVGYSVSFTSAGSGHGTQITLWMQAPGGGSETSCGGGGGSPYGPITASGTAGFSTTGTWTLRARDGGTQSSAILSQVTINVASNSTPATFSFSNRSFTYDGSTKTASVTPSPGNATYTADLTKGPGVGSYTVSATANGNFTGSGSATLTISAAGQSSVSISPGSQSVYVGTTITFTASGGGIGGYNWGGSASGTGSTKSVTFNSTGTYTVTLQSPGDANHSASNVASVTITVTTVPDTTPPSAPPNPQVSNITSSSFTFSWGASSDNVGVTGYRVQLDSGSYLDVGNVLSYTFTSLAAGSVHTSKVFAHDAAYNWSGATSIGASTSGGGGGSGFSPESAWIDINGDGILDRVAGDHTNDFNFAFVSWYTTDPGLSPFDLRLSVYSVDNIYAQYVYVSFGRVWLSPSEFNPTYITHFELIFNANMDVDEDTTIYRDTTVPTDPDLINPAHWELPPILTLPANSLGGYHNVHYNIDSPPGLDHVRYYAVTTGKPVGGVQLGLPGFGTLKVGSNGQFGSITLPGGTTISASSGTVTVSGTGTVSAGGSLTLPGGTVIQVDGSGNASITFLDGTIITISSSGALGLKLPAGAPSLLVQTVDTLGKVLTVQNNKIVFSVKNALGQLIPLPNSGILDIADIGIDTNGIWQIGIKQGTQGDAQAIWIPIDVQVQPPPPRIVLLLHGMNSDIHTWDPFVQAAFNGSVGDIPEPGVPIPTPTPDARGVRCFRLQFGRFDTTLGRPGIDGLLPTDSSNAAPCGDFEDFATLGREIDDAITRLRNTPLYANADIVLVGHSRGGLAARAFLQISGTPANMAAVVGLLTTGSPHQGSPLGRIYQWLADHPNNPRGSAPLYNQDWGVVDWLRVNARLDVRRPVIGDLAVNPTDHSYSSALDTLNARPSVANLPSGMRYGEIMYDQVSLGILKYGIPVIGSYSVFDGIPGLVDPLTDQAKAFILGTDSTSGAANTPIVFQGDGLVPAGNQWFRTLPGFQGSVIPPFVGAHGSVVHIDEPGRTTDLINELHLVVDWWK
jgi:hypothetical protein